MPPVRTTKRSASPADHSPSPVQYTTPWTATSAPVVQLDSYTFPTPVPETNASPAKKKRSHGKTRPPGHIPRPPNAFIIFRTDYIKSMSTHSTPEVSKNLGAMWKKMTRLEKQPWVEKAQDAKIEHRKAHPDYKYKPVHPRDAEGRCIRKPRKPNQPRVKYAPNDLLDHLPVSFQWMERPEAELPSTSLLSDTSSVSSPPRSPSPAPSAYFTQGQALYQTYRRSSSVPPPRPDDRFFFGMAPDSGSMYPPSPSATHTGHMSRRLSKRPSTSMDFTCAGPPHPEMYPSNDGTAYAGEPSQWRPVHRRSISAPGYGLGGDIAMGQYAHAPSDSYASQLNPLTPINPVFGSVFDKFSWNTPSNAQHAPPAYDNTMPPYITLNIPSMTNSPTSNISSATSPPASTPGDSTSPSPSRTPAIHHPAPVASFDIRAFQINEFDGATTPHPFEQTPADGFDNALGLVPAPGSYAYHDDGARSQGTDYPAVGVAESSYAGDAHNSAGNMEGGFAQAANLRGYEEGARCMQPEPPARGHALHFNELIVEGY